MAIARKPKEVVKFTDLVAKEKSIEALIEKGGSSAHVNSIELTDEDIVKPVLLRLYNSHINDIGEILRQLPKRQRVSRHAYIIQAVEEKIQRDKSKRK